LNQIAEAISRTPAAVATDKARPYSVDAERLLPEDGRVSDAVAPRQPLWIFLVVGAVVGLGVGILVSVTTDVPLAPELGAVIGAAAGWAMRVVTAGPGEG
jgi:hypothetical protein